MVKKNNKDSKKDFVFNFLKKNNNFFLEHPELLKLLIFPSENNYSNKVIDLNAYRSQKIKHDYEKLNKQMSAILKAAKNHVVSQKRILKTSLKILNTKNLNKLIDLITNDLGSLLDCDFINCFFTSNKISHKKISLIDNRIATSYFRDKPQTYLNQNPKGIPLFFPNKSNIIKSYILLKIVFESDRFIIALGSKNEKKFTKDQQVDLVEYLIQVIQIKLLELN